MDFMELVKTTRSTRRFKQTKIQLSDLEELIEFARYSPSGANKQPLKYYIVNNDDEKNKIFPLIKWAGALKDWDGPSEDERPTAYIIMLLDKSIANTPGLDHGIAAQSIMLGARSKGIGCCMIGAYNKPELQKVLAVNENMETLLILALGEPDENIVIEDYREADGLAYYRDVKGNHHVPKRLLTDMIWSKDK